MAQAFCSYSDNSALYLWEQGSCGYHQLCVPYNSTTGICDCRFSAEMFQNGAGWCELSSASYGAASTYLFIGCVLSIAFCWKVGKLARVRHALAVDSLLITEVSLLGWLFSVSLYQLARALDILYANSDGGLVAFYNATQDISIFFAIVTNLNFGVNLLIVSVLANNLSKVNPRHVRRRAIGAAVVLGVLLIAIVGPTTALGDFAIANACVTVWVALVWTVLHFASRNLLASCAAEVSGPNSQIAIIRGTVREASAAVTVIVLCGLVYVSCTYAGRYYRSWHLLGTGCCASMIVSNTADAALSLVFLKFTARSRELRMTGGIKMDTGSSTRRPVALFMSHSSETIEKASATTVYTNWSLQLDPSQIDHTITSVSNI